MHVKRDSVGRQKKNKYKYLIAYPFLHRNFVVVSDGVFTQEVKLHHIFLTIILWVQFDVFNPQRTAAHSVSGLSFLLLITRSKSQLEEVAYQESLTKVSLQNTLASMQLEFLELWLYMTMSVNQAPHLVDEVERHSPLSDPHLLRLPVFAVLGPDAVHTLLQSTSRFIFLPILFSL